MPARERWRDTEVTMAENKPVVRLSHIKKSFGDAEVLKEYIEKNSPLDAAAYEPKGEVSWQ